MVHFKEALAWSAFIQPLMVHAGAIPPRPDRTTGLLQDTISMPDDPAEHVSLLPRQGQVHVPGKANKDCFVDYESCISKAVRLTTSHHRLYSQRLKEFHHLNNTLQFFKTLPDCGWLADMDYGLSPFRRDDHSSDKSSSTTTSSAAQATQTGQSSNGTQPGSYSSVDVKWCAMAANCVEDTRQHRLNITVIQEELNNFVASSQALNNKYWACAYTRLPKSQIVPTSPDDILLGNSSHVTDATRKFRRSLGSNEGVYAGDMQTFHTECEEQKSYVSQQEREVLEILHKNQENGPMQAISSLHTKRHANVVPSILAEQIHPSMLVARNDKEKKKMKQFFNDFQVCKSELEEAMERLAGLFRNIGDLQAGNTGNLNNVPFKRDVASTLTSKTDQQGYSMAVQVAQFWKSLAEQNYRELINVTKRFADQGWTLVQAIKKLGPVTYVRQQTQANGAAPALPPIPTRNVLPTPSVDSSSAKPEQQIVTKTVMMPTTIFDVNTELPPLPTRNARPKPLVSSTAKPVQKVFTEFVTMPTIIYQNAPQPTVIKNVGVNTQPTVTNNFAVETQPTVANNAAVETQPFVVLGLPQGL